MLNLVQARSLAPKLLWYALQVRARYEKSVETSLHGMGYETFLPLSKSIRQWSDRKREIDSPLFPGYIFCRFNAQNRLPILKTPGMLQIVGYSRIPIPIDEGEISAIQSVIASGLPNQPCPFLEAGDRVIVQGGPLMGLEGILLECRGKNRLILSINLLQRSIAVEINSNHVARHPKDSVYTDCNSSRFELEYAS